jgi:chromosome partitioning protein
LARIICIANQKGGVGKTTTAINLSSAIAKGRHQTLLIDLDPQCNATSGLGHFPAEHHPLTISTSFREQLLATADDFLKLLPGSRNFVDVEKLAEGIPSSKEMLQGHIASAANAFDFIVIDCPPSLGELTQTALTASTEVLMPIQCEYFAMEGLTQMIELIRDVMHTQQPTQLEFSGILLTMYDHNYQLTREVDDEVREFFGDIVFETVIPRDIQVAESGSHGKPVLDYAPRSQGSRGYIELGMEILEHV